MELFSRNFFTFPLSSLHLITVKLAEMGLAMCVNRIYKYGLYYELHSTAYSPISFISSVDMELTSSGTHSAGGLEAVQGIIQDYQLLVQAQYYPNAHAHTLYYVHVHQH